MLTGGREWDTELLDDLFVARDRDLIKCIPLSLQATNDSWYWLLDEKGEYTVRSCYRFLQGECRDDHSKLWKKIWALKLPNKVVNLIWRLCRGVLPTNAALVSKFVNIAPDCPWCRSHVETDIHVMFLCNFAKTVWRMVGLEQLVSCLPNETPTAIFERVFEQGTKDQCTEVAMLCWSIWSRRNRWVWDRDNGSVFGVKNTASYLLREWQEAQVAEARRKSRVEVGDRIWSPPLNGWLKINVDAAVFMNGYIGVGAVIRDDRGGFVAARCMKISGGWKPREAEAIGLKEALSWVIDRGYSNCWFETDSYVLADAVNGKPGRALFGTIVMDCVQLLKHINQVLVSFSFRSANKVAHVLAQATSSMTDIGEWYVTPPNFLTHVLELDMID